MSNNINTIDFKIILLGQDLKKMSFFDCRFGSRSQKNFLVGYEELRASSYIKLNLSNLCRSSMADTIRIESFSKGLMAFPTI